jgi:hypothetical protein
MIEVAIDIQETAQWLLVAAAFDIQKKADLLLTEIFLYM